MTLPADPQLVNIRPEPSLRDYVDVIRRRRAVFIQVAVLVLVAGIVITALQKPIYRTTAKLVVPQTSPNVSIIDASSPIATMLAAAAPDTVSTQIEVLQSSEFLSEARERAGVTARPGVIPPAVRVEGQQNTNIIRIQVEGGDPAEITRLANAILDLHIERTDLLRATGLKDTLEFVRKQAKEAYDRLQAADNQLQQFRRAHRIAATTAAEDARIKEYAGLEAKLRDEEREITVLESDLALLRRRLEAEPISLVQETPRENPRREKLQEQLDERKTRRTLLALQYREGHRILQDLDAEIAALEKQIQAEPEVIMLRTHAPNPARLQLLTSISQKEIELEGRRSAYKILQEQLAKARGTVDNLGPWEVQHSRLVLERDQAQQAYAQLTDHLRQLEIRAQARSPVARVIEKAGQPTYPIKPNRVANLVITGILALSLGVGMAFLQEYLDDRLNSPDEVSRLTGLPTLGHVPALPEDQPRLLSDLPTNSHAAEAYRALRSSIGFAAIDAPVRRLVVTSPSKGEGKTMTSVNLATAMAMDGKRVLLIDGDMRRPSVHRLLDLPGAPGLSEVLAGLKKVDEVIQNTDIANLRVLCAGTVPPTPAELLGSNAFDRVLDEVDDSADVIIFDSPPCLPVTDPLLIAARTDGVLLVVHANQTRRGALRHAEELLTRARARVLGVLFNQVQQGRSGYYYHYYYYYYGDGYYADTARRGANARRNGRRRGLPPAASASEEATALEPQERDS